MMLVQFSKAIAPSRENCSR